MKYRVSHQGQEAGPFTLDQVVDKIRAKELELFDFIYDESKGDWVLLMEHADVAGRLKANKPTGKPKTETAVEAAPAPKQVTTPAPATTDAHDIGEWFVLKGEHRFGPFQIEDIVRMLQQKVVFPFDFIWHAGLPDWKRVAEIEEFKPENIKTLFENAGKKSDVFVPRKHKRKKYSNRVIIHDNLSLWRGQGFEISKGGVGVVMPNALIVPGQQVFVHFTGDEGWPSFNAVCEVVSKKFVSDDRPVEYGLRFLSLSQDVQEEFYRKVS